MKRRALLLAGLPIGVQAQIRRGRLLTFPRDHGVHLDAGTEWWYATGWLGSESTPRFGFQLTFFRSRTGLADGVASRFAARQLLFAHAAVTDLAAPRHLHAQRIARWSGDAPSALASAATGDTDVRLAGWSLRHENERYMARLPADDFTLDLALQTAQAPLLQGDAGFSRKGPEEHQASHYYSQPQLQVTGGLTVEGRRFELPGRAWLDHEWSDEYLAPQAVGWDWIGFNLFDGSALMAFRVRRADGSALWAGGSFRAADGKVLVFANDTVRFVPGRVWASPASQARYPVDWRVETPAGAFDVRSLMDAQELDSRGSTGAIYWEGLSELRDAQGRRVGLGYLEMTGYAARLQMN